MLELPEVLTLSSQLHRELRGKTIASAGPGNSPHKFAFIKPSALEFSKVLAKKRIEAVRGDGKCIYILLKPRAVLSIAEMDGRLSFHPKGAELPAKYQLLLSFSDGTRLTATVGLWAFFGVGNAAASPALDQSNTIDPLGDDFTLEVFEQLFVDYPKPNHAIKAFLINRPRLRGFGNGYMQEMLFRSGIQPMRKVGSIAPDEKRRLYRAIREVLREGVRQGGSTDFCDIYGQPGKYAKALGAKVKQCRVCAGAIEKKSFLGGATYFCPRCQR